MHERFSPATGFTGGGGVNKLMRVLIIKTSSMGDVIHTLPALTDAGKALPGIRFDWVVEESFAEIPHWHPLVDKVIPVALRRWRKNIFSAQTRKEWVTFYKKLRSTEYDLIIDAQGLLKSAFLVALSKGIRCGLNWQSAREPLASLFYQRKCNGGKIKEAHAIARTRRLFQEALGYKQMQLIPDYGVDRRQFMNKASPASPYVVFLHGTTWPTKHWPEEYWIKLAQKLALQNLTIKLPWGNPLEQERAQRIAFNCTSSEVLPRMKLADIARVLADAKAIVAVDTGLGHLAAALDVPTISLYGPTNPALTGALGKSQIHLSAKFKCAPCFNTQCTYREISPLKVSTIHPACFTTVTPEDVNKALVGLL